MTLVAIYHNPPSSATTHELSHSHSKWKRGLAFISPKYYYNKKKYKSSPTTAAAATEKVLCHGKEHVKCEDLTAKEFAKMAGIKIKSEEVDASTVDQTVSSFNKQNLLTVDDPMITQMTSFSARTALSSKSCHQIWDSDFWQCTSNNNNNNNNTRLCKINTSSTTSNESKACPSVIQKGRFKIVLGHQDTTDDEPTVNHHHIVLEWKRKRSNSTATKQ